MSEIPGLISTTVDATAGQLKNIDQMNSMIMQISVVNQNNSAVSEEESAAAELLSEQPDPFKNTDERLILRDNR